jgi:pyrroloquinoline quinone biosynthesis protein D
MPSIRPTRSETLGETLDETLSENRVEKRAVSGAVSELGTAVASSSRPKLAPHLRMRFDTTRKQHVLLGPETVVALNQTGADILAFCDGRHTVAEIVAILHDRYDRVVGDEVRHFLARLTAKRYVEISNG